MRPDVLALLFCLVLASPVLARGKAAKGEPAAISHAGSLNLALAVNYLDSGLLPQAQDRIGRALASDPRSADVQTVRALIHDRLGQQDLAAEAFALAAKFAPEDGSVNNAYGAWLCGQGSLAEGQAFLEKAEARPGRQKLRNVLVNAGSCALKAGDHEKAERKLRQVLQDAPEDGAALLLMARVKHALGQFLDARAFLQRREALGPLSAEAYELAIQIETGAGDPRTAERYRALLRERYPEHTTPTGEGAGRP